MFLIADQYFCATSSCIQDNITDEEAEKNMVILKEC